MYDSISHECLYRDEREYPLTTKGGEGERSGGNNCAVRCCLANCVTVLGSTGLIAR